MWLWTILRAPQSIWQGCATKCSPLSGISKVRLEVGQSVVSGYFRCLPHGLRDMCMTRLGLLALNGYGSRVVGILIRRVCNIGWCIVGRQAIWWEGMFALDLHKMGVARISQHFASLTYHIQDWTIYLINTRSVNRVHLSDSTCGSDWSRVDLHHFSHTHHDLHHGGHLVFYGLHVSLHLFLNFLHITHDSSLGMCSVRVS